MILFAVAIVCFGVLVSGCSYSEWVLPGNLPLGNALTSIGLCSSAGSAFCLCPAGSVRRRIARVVLLGAALWLPISIALAGNLALNFSGFRGTAWLVISLATAIVVLGSMLMAIAGALVPKLRQSNDNI